MSRHLHQSSRRRRRFCLKYPTTRSENTAPPPESEPKPYSTRESIEDALHVVAPLLTLRQQLGEGEHSIDHAMRQAGLSN